MIKKEHEGHGDLEVDTGWKFIAIKVDTERIHDDLTTSRNAAL
jgi:hypothetical protein